ncbi:unnamed protein product [Cuscuta epithymum]|uniref:DUF7895 domain-containing protein n=1 Tax=Cuscuta epithymum TaxID=186058 RepID=A0AAV0DAR8_9ASTE|nr:unnamed protein product [Cuscuta epithymum]CAH9138093.1 unnamed protein product [Cuscuta epithymum]
MELILPHAQSSLFALFSTTRESKYSYSYSVYRSIGSRDDKRSNFHARKELSSSALPETLASIAVAATVVGAATTLLIRRTKASNSVEVPTKMCEDCGGTGICSGCKGEGFVVKKMSEESAVKARATAQNAATRYTAGLPKKWSYCTKCNAARSCSSCSGNGKLLGSSSTTQRLVRLERQNAG